MAATLAEEWGLRFSLAEGFATQGTYFPPSESANAYYIDDEQEALEDE